MDKVHGGMGMGSPTIAAKIKATMIRNHGVEYAWQIPDVQDKIQKSCKMFKDYTMPSGRVVRIQGYEHYGIDELLKMCRQKTNYTNIRTPLGSYTMNSKSSPAFMQASCFNRFSLCHLP